LISHFDLYSHTTGFDAFPPDARPEPVRVHWGFDVMVGCGFFMLAVGGLFWFLYWKRKYRLPENKWVLWGVTLAGICGFVAVECGWITTEEGRQPWIIYGLMRVSYAVTPDPWMPISFLVFCFIYILLGATLISFLILLAKRREPVGQWSDYVVQGELEKEPVR
jgi:cytochrome d ubiquinol oxidase subunit I